MCVLKEIREVVLGSFFQNGYKVIINARRKVLLSVCRLRRPFVPLDARTTRPLSLARRERERDAQEW